MALSPTQVSPEPCSLLAPGRAYSPRSLPGGTANRGLVIRVGDTVVRPTAPCRAATHALLGHLAAAGFDGAPRVLGAGPVTETLTYIDGRAAASFAPAGYAWPRPVAARYRAALVSHNDVYPANVVFREGRAVALIDFDLAGPGSATWDFAAAARSFVPLLDEGDVLDSRAGPGLERFRVFLAAAGLTRAGRLSVAGALIANHDWTYAIVTEAA